MICDKALVANSMMKVAVYFSLVALAASFQFQKEWDSWKAQYGKRYDDDMEELSRHAIWESNKLYVEEHNANADKWGYILDTNEYADMESAEFAKLFNGLAAEEEPPSTVYVPGNVSADPASVDWRDKGYVTPVKNQGQCGSCWAFSTTGSLEGQHFKKTGKLVSLSEQQLMDCSKMEGNHGCEGGLMVNAFRYIEKNGGIDTEESYPYEAEDERRCKFKKADIGATCTGFVKIKKDNCEELRNAVATVGPISVGMDASGRSFQLYKSGIYQPRKCSSKQLDHGVLVVGYGREEGERYWIIKNSWGKHWGMKGYFNIAAAENLCGICTSASYPTV